MPGPFSTLNTSMSAIRYQQAALDIASTNIANATTEGYVRRRVVPQTVGVAAAPRTCPLRSGRLQLSADPRFVVHVHDLVEQGALDGHPPLVSAQGWERGLASHILELAGQRRVDGDGHKRTPIHPAASCGRFPETTLVSAQARWSPV